MFILNVGVNQKLKLGMHNVHVTCSVQYTYATFPCMAQKQATVWAPLMYNECKYWCLHVCIFILPRICSDTWCNTKLARKLWWLCIYVPGFVDGLEDYGLTGSRGGGLDRVQRVILCTHLKLGSEKREGKGRGRGERGEKKERGREWQTKEKSKWRGSTQHKSSINYTLCTIVGCI